MSIKYYTHFVTSHSPETLREYSGVVELQQQVVPSSSENKKSDAQAIATILARTLQIDSEDIHILQWSRLH